MNKHKKLLSAIFASFMAVAMLLPVQDVQAAEVQPLRFPVYVNGSLVTINDSLLYNNYTYVKLRDVAAVTNMGIDFVQPGTESLPMVGGNKPEGITITQPSFVYVNDQVPNWTKEMGTEKYFKGVDITGIYSKYFDEMNKKDLKYSFNSKGLLIKENGKETQLEFKVLPSYEREYMTVDDFREYVQPYFVDICMQ